MPYIETAAWADRFDEAKLAAIAPEIQTRVKVLSEVPGYVDFLFLERPVMENDSVAKAITNNEAGGVLAEQSATYGELAGEWRAKLTQRRLRWQNRLG